MIYGDNLIQADLRRLLDFHTAHGGIGTVALFHHPNPTAAGIVAVEADGRITRFVEKPPADLKSSATKRTRAFMSWTPPCWPRFPWTLPPTSAGTSSPVSWPTRPAAVRDAPRRLPPGHGHAPGLPAGELGPAGRPDRRALRRPEPLDRPLSPGRARRVLPRPQRRRRGSGHRGRRRSHRQHPLGLGRRSSRGGRCATPSSRPGVALHITPGGQEPSQ